MKKFAYLTVSGFVLGLSMFAPGFSGSIVAMIMGFYQDLIKIVSNPFKNFKENVKFCTPMLLGALASAVVFILAFSYLFEAHPRATHILFIGLIAGNLPMIFKDVKKNPVTKGPLIAMVIAFVFTAALGIFGAMEFVDGAAAAYSPVRMFIGGLIVGTSFFIPGMSVSTILLILGIYAPLMESARLLLSRDFTHLPAILVFALGMLVAMALTSRLIRRLFEKYTILANAMVFGFVTGSLFGIATAAFQLHDENFTIFAGIVALLLGLFFSAVFLFLGKFQNKNKEKNQD